MADKTSFTKDEWALLLRSPMNAGMAITAAEPSGLFGLLKESFAEKLLFPISRPATAGLQLTMG